MSESNYTIVLKLHEPSGRKKEIIDEAMLNYSKAYQYLLKEAEKHLNELIEMARETGGRFRTFNIKSWISGDVDKRLKDFSIEPFKDSLKIDFSASLSAFIDSKIKGKKVSFPCVYIDKENFEEEYIKVLQGYIDETAESETEDRIDRLINKSEKLRPLFFCRYSINRNYSILYDAEKDRYFAKLYLMNVKNNKRKKSEKSGDKSLMYISESREIYKEGRTKNTFIIVPLSFGKWQKRFLKKALDNPRMLRTARLIKKKDEYYLAVNIEDEKPEEIETVNYMGIARGFGAAANYSITDNKGGLLTEGFLKFKGESVSVDNLHSLSNELINLAKEFKCQIVMEKLIDKGDFLTWIDKNGKVVVPVIGCQNYNQLYNIINYKALRNGLPGVIRVSGVNIYYTCPCCGSISRKNRFSADLMICTSCGTSRDINKVGSFNLANKINTYSRDTVEIIVENSDKGVRFINWELDLDYYPSNPYNCADEFAEVIDNIIKTFYVNIDNESKKENFKMKFGLIKKIEANKDIFELTESD